MTTWEMTHQYRLSQWAELLREQKRSGYRINEWCDERGISRHSYFYWQRKLRDAATTELTVQNAVVPSGFKAIVTIDEPKNTNQALTIEVSGCKAFVNPDVDTELLTKVLRVLKAL